MRYSYLYMPVSAPQGGAFRLSFVTTAQGVSCSGNGGVVTAVPGLTQLDFRLPPNSLVNAFLRTDAMADINATNILIEQLG